MLFKMASPEMQAALSQEAGARSELRPSDFFGAAHAMLPFLGINRSAWNDAITTMGEQATWLAILCLDANRDHPQTPVRNVGGALRAVTRKARDGKFYLDGTVIGLAHRKGVRDR
jgi:replication initiation protein RepC